MRLNKCIEYKISDELYTLLPVGNNCISRYVLIDDISYEVYHMMKEGLNFNEIVESMLEIYDVNEKEFKEDLINILNQWFKYGVLYDEKETRQFICDEGIEISENENFYDEQELTDIEIYDMMYQAAIERNEPFKVYFEITHNCNLRCRHCYIQESVNKQEDIFLSKDVIIKTIDDLKKMGTHEIVLTGGECTVHTDFLEIVSYICECGMKLTILSNANKIDDAFVDRIIDLPIADIRVSIYGTSETHDKMTAVKGSFDKSFRALKMLRKRKGIGTAVILVTVENYKEIADLTNLFMTNDIEYDFNAFIFPTTEGDARPTDYRITEYIDDFVDNYVINCSGSKCAAGISRFRIDPEGNVSPCDLLKHEKLGNIYNNTFYEIFHSNLRNEWIDKLNKILISNVCSKCESKKFCNACLGLLYMEHHTYDEKVDFLCRFTEAKKNKYERIINKKYDIYSE